MKLASFLKKKQYQLLPVSSYNIHLGDLVDARSGLADFLGRDLDMLHRNITTDLSIYYDDFSEEKSEALYERIKAQEPQPGQLPQLSIEERVQGRADLDIPLVADLTADMDSKQVSSYAFENVKIKTFDEDLQGELRKQLYQFRKQDEDKFKEAFREGWTNWLHLIEQLLYADVKITVDKQRQGQLEGNVKQLSHVETKATVKHDKAITYTFANAEVPFAMELAGVKEFV